MDYDIIGCDYTYIGLLAVGYITTMVCIHLLPIQVLFYFTVILRYIFNRSWICKQIDMYCLFK